MLDLIIGLFSGDKLILLGAAAAALLGAIVGIYRSGRKAGVNSQRAKEAEANEKLLEQARRAGDARAAADRRGVPDGDPYNRDN